MMHPYRSLFESMSRTIVGVMSGTSLDAVDVAVVRLSGTGKEISVEVLGTGAAPIPNAVRSVILASSDPGTSNVRDLTLLNSLLAQFYAESIGRTLDEVGIHIDEIDAIGMHGQTVYHQPETAELAEYRLSGTLQIGDPSILANLLKKPVVGDFRQADMALGGQGAPLVPYADYVCFASETEGRLLLNLGGIANLTVLAAGGTLSDIIAFDTGPANMVIDELSMRLFNREADTDGRIAERGRIDESLLEYLLAESYFSRIPPKSTGRELFSTRYTDAIIRMAIQRGLRNEDMIATATELTVRTILRAWKEFVPDRIDQVIVAGGGLHNPVLMRGLKDGFGSIPVESTERHGIPPDWREAICFAVLAHECLNGTPANVPSATGASRSTILGKICIPG